MGATAFCSIRVISGVVKYREKGWFGHSPTSTCYKKEKHHIRGAFSF